MNSLIFLATQTATTRSRWLHVLAEDRAISIAALARELQTTEALETEVARFIVRRGQQDAVHYFQDKKRPPELTDDSTLRDHVCAHHYQLLKEAEWERLKAETADVMDELAQRQGS